MKVECAVRRVSLALGAVLLFGGCDLATAPDRSPGTASVEGRAAGVPRMQENGADGGGGTTSTTSAQDTTGRDGVYIGSGH